MTTLRELLLVLAFLVSAQCEMRARDPEVEEQREGLGRGEAGVRTTDTPPLRDTGNSAAQTGYMQPVLKQKEKMVSVLGWRCCHTGNNYELTGYDTSGDVNLHRKQNDHEGAAPHHSGSTTSQHNLPSNLSPDHAHTFTQHHHKQLQPQQQREDVDKANATALPSYPEDPSNLTAHPEAPAPLPVPQMIQLVMSQLQPIFQGINRSLEMLTQQVAVLSRDVAQLKVSQRGAWPVEGAGAAEGEEQDEGVEERLDARLDEVFVYMKEVRRQVEQQQVEVESRLHSQHAMLHYNLTSFKTDTDLKLKRHHKMLQVSLQAMNTTLAEQKQGQGQDQDLTSPTRQQPTPSDISALWEAIERLDNKLVNNSVKVGGLMEDVEVTMDGMEQLGRHLKELESNINQTARKSQVLFMETGLEVEDAKVLVLRRVEQLAANLSVHDRRLQEMDVDVDYLYTALYRHNATTTTCDCHGLRYAMVHLEKRVANVTELANENKLALEESGERGGGHWEGAGEWDELQHALQEVKESVSLEQTRTNSLEEDLSRLSALSSLLKEAEGRLEAQLKHLSGSFASLLKDAIRHSEVLELLLGEEVLEFLDWPLQDQEAHSIPALKEQLGLLQEQLNSHKEHKEELNRGATGVREERPSADQPSSSSSSSSLADDWLAGGRRQSMGRVPARERQLLIPVELQQVGRDGGDLWNLEKRVEEVQRQLVQLEETPPCVCSDTFFQREAAQQEVLGLTRELEEHLRVFKKVFSNAEVMATIDATVDLHQLWKLLRSKDRRRKGKRRTVERRSVPKRGAKHSQRARSALGGLSPSAQSGFSVLFVGGAPWSSSDGVLVFKASLNRGHAYFDGGIFKAPSDGIYLFTLTLDLRPGPTHLLLKRVELQHREDGGGATVSLLSQKVKEAGPVSGVALLLLRKGEELRLELRAGEWAESKDNMLVGLLLHHLQGAPRPEGGAMF